MFDHLIILKKKKLTWVFLINIIFLMFAGQIKNKKKIVLESSKENCDRECHELDWPSICRFKIVLETQRVQK